MSNRFNLDSVNNDSHPLSPRSYYYRYMALTQNQNQNQNQNPYVNRRFLPSSQNLVNDNQTLEHAFSRLSVTDPNRNPNPSFVYGLHSWNDFDLPYYNYGFQACNQPQETGIGYNRDVNGADFAPFYMRADRDSYGFIGGNGNNILNGGGLNLLNDSSSANVTRGMNNNYTNVNGTVNVSGSDLHWFDDIRGRVYLMAKDQHGSRILQNVIEKLKLEGVSCIFTELINHMAELMIDPFGNYVIQKMVDFCNQDQMTQMVLMVTPQGYQFIRICLSPHGSRAVEKMLENVTTREQRTLIMSALAPGAHVLCRDINAHRVVLYCMKNFTHDDTKKFLTVLASNTYPIAKDKTGCCVLQQCISHAQGETKNQLMNDIIFNARLLSEDCYGNYVVQHLLTLKIPSVAESLYRQFERQFASISCNKYGSNVVEKFLIDSGSLLSAKVMLELLRDPNASRLLVDPYGNYVISTALEKFKDTPSIKNALLDLIQENSHVMRSNMFGKKLLDKSDKERMMRQQI